jgi:peptidoglycan/LPS O-acetylase OafA/YrhL
VLLGHFGAPGFPSGGAVGVSLFFVLSGFLITALLLEEHAARGKVNWITFYIRRASRLLPALLVYVAVIGLTGDASWTAIATVAGYVANWALIAGVDLGALAHAWSLSVEEQFYIVWPLTLGILVRRGWTLQGTVIAIGISTALLFQLSGNHLRAFAGSDTRAQNILAGCIIAIAFHRWGERRMPTAAAVVAAGALVFLTTTAFYGQLFAVTLPAAVLVAWAAVRPQVLSWPVLAFTGRISYGLYLWHYPFAFGHWPIFDDVAQPFSLVVKVAAAFALAGTSWVLVERRVLRYVRRTAHLPAPGRASPQLVE